MLCSIVSATDRSKGWVDGGWGIDALVGEQTRPHDDLDLVVAQAALETAQAALGSLGFRHAAAARPGLPARLVLHAGDGKHVDLHPVMFDRHGNGWQPLGRGAWGAYSRRGPNRSRRDRRPPGPLPDPDLQLRHHLGYPPNNNDHHDLHLLAEHFGLGLPPAF